MDSKDKKIEDQKQEKPQESQDETGREKVAVVFIRHFRKPENGDHPMPDSEDDKDDKKDSSASPSQSSSRSTSPPGKTGKTNWKAIEKGFNKLFEDLQKEEEEGAEAAKRAKKDRPEFEGRDQASNRREALLARALGNTDKWERPCPILRYRTYIAALSNIIRLDNQIEVKYKEIEENIDSIYEDSNLKKPPLLKSMQLNKKLLAQTVEGFWTLRTYFMNHMGSQNFPKNRNHHHLVAGLEVVGSIIMNPYLLFSAGRSEEGFYHYPSCFTSDWTSRKIEKVIFPEDGGSIQFVLTSREKVCVDDLFDEDDDVEDNKEKEDEPDN